MVKQPKFLSPYETECVRQTKPAKTSLYTGAKNFNPVPRIDPTQNSACKPRACASPSIFRAPAA